MKLSSYLQYYFSISVLLNLSVITGHVRLFDVHLHKQSCCSSDTRYAIGNTQAYIRFILLVGVAKIIV